MTVPSAPAVGRDARLRLAVLACLAGLRLLRGGRGASLAGVLAIERVERARLLGEQCREHGRQEGVTRTHRVSNRVGLEAAARIGTAVLVAVDGAL